MRTPSAATPTARSSSRAIEEATTSLSTAQIVDVLDRAGVPCAPIADFAGVFTDAHLHQREYFWDAPDPQLGPVRQLGSPMRLSRTPARRDHAGPALGADTRSALLGVGYSAAEVDEMVAVGAAAESTG